LNRSFLQIVKNCSFHLISSPLKECSNLHPGMQSESRYQCVKISLLSNAGGDGICSDGNLQMYVMDKRNCQKQYGFANMQSAIRAWKRQTAKIVARALSIWWANAPRIVPEKG
jgi:hypothetical protein